MTKRLCYGYVVAPTFSSLSPFLVLAKLDQVDNVLVCTFLPAATGEESAKGHLASSKRMLIRFNIAAAQYFEELLQKPGLRGFGSSSTLRTEANLTGQPRK